MLFGQQASFGIEADVAETESRWLYGRLGFWVDGALVGARSETSSLSVSCWSARTFLSASDRRSRPDLDELDAEAVFDLLYGRYVRPVHAPVSRPWAGPWDRDPYLLDDVGESSLRDKVAMLVVRRANGTDRLLTVEFDQGTVRQSTLPSGHCDRVVASYCDWVSSLASATDPRG